jgi:hypothetical protein
MGMGKGHVYKGSRGSDWSKTPKIDGEGVDNNFV